MSVVLHEFSPNNSLSGIKLFVDGRMVRNSGIGTHILEHGKGLEKLGAELTFSSQTPEDDELIRSFVANSRIVRVNAKIYSIRERFLPFVIPPVTGHQHAYWFPQYNAPLHLPKPSIVTIHDLIQFRYNPERRRRGRAMLGRMVLLRAVRKAAGVICPSDATRNDLLEFVAQRDGLERAFIEKTIVIRNGVSSRWNHVDPDSRRAARELAGEKPYLLFVGNGKAHKNPRLVIELGIRLANEGFPLKVVIVDSHPDQYLESQMARFHQHKHLIVRTGHVSAQILAGLYAEAAVLLMPSLYEGFGLPPLEAMMAGTPVIVSNRGGLRDAVGSGGILCDPFEPHVWHKEVVRLLEDDSYRAFWSDQGRRWASRNTWQRSTAEFGRYIRRLVEGGTGAGAGSAADKAHATVA